MALEAFLNQLVQELHFTTLFTLFRFSLLLVFLLSLLFLSKLSRSSKHNLPPCPPRVPIIGNLHQLGTLPHRTLRALSQKYGPLMLIHLGQTPTLIVSSAEMAREMMKTHDIVFSNRPKITAADFSLYGCVDIVFSPYGEYWREVRRISVHELLSPKRVQEFQFVREEQITDLINKIRGVSLKGASVNLSEMLLAITNDIVARCVFSKKANEETKFGTLSRRLTTQFQAFSFGDLFPVPGWMDYLTGLIPSLKATFRELDTFFDEVIAEHGNLKRVDEISDAKDFVDILLQVQRDSKLKFELTQDNLKAILLDMFVGGTDSTSTTMEWAMAELMKHPSMLNKAQEEVSRVVGKKSKIEVGDINQMEYLKCVIKESLRLHAPAPLLVHRETSSSVKMGGYEIPAKTRVFVNAWAIQRDPKLWDNPEEFIPERFYDNPVSFMGKNFHYIPFGAGRRGCPGTLFGIATVENVMANLLYWFDWKLPGGAAGEDLDMTEAFGPSVYKKIPLHLVPMIYSV